jgi:hypothetical protein
LEGGTGAQKKKGPGGQRNSLIRLDSAKEIQGFSLQKFGQILLDGAGIWLDLGLAWRKFGFNARVQPSRQTKPLKGERWRTRPS